MKKGTKSVGTGLRYKNVLIGGTAGIILSAVLLLGMVLLVGNEYLELSAAGNLVYGINFVAVFVGVLLTGKISGSNMLTCAVLTPLFYCVVLFGLGIAMFGGLKVTAILTFVICIAAGFFGHLAGYAMQNKAAKSKKRRRGW